MKCAIEKEKLHRQHFNIGTFPSPNLVINKSIVILAKGKKSSPLWLMIKWVQSKAAMASFGFAFFVTCTAALMIFNFPSLYSQIQHIEYTGAYRYPQASSMLQYNCCMGLKCSYL